MVSCDYFQINFNTCWFICHHTHTHKPLHTTHTYTRPQNHIHTSHLPTESFFIMEKKQVLGKGKRVLDEGGKAKKQKATIKDTSKCDSTTCDTYTYTYTHTYTYTYTYTHTHFMFCSINLGRRKKTNLHNIESHSVIQLHSTRWGFANHGCENEKLLHSS